MKKIIVMIMAVVLVVTMMAGCNMSLGFGNYNYEKIHVDTYHYSGCFTVEKWYENESGIEVLTEEVGSMYLSEGTYVMLEGDKECPFCAEKDWSDIIDGIIP